MEALSKDKIERWILPYLSKRKRGPEPGVELRHLVELIFYRLKTGCQRRMLLLDWLLKEGRLSWQGIYYHHYKWVKDGSWQRVWIVMLKANPHLLDLSSIRLDGSHSLCKKQGEAIAYQSRKSGQTTNVLILADNEGQPLAVATPQAGNHHDLFNIEALFEREEFFISAGRH